MQGEVTQKTSQNLASAETKHLTQQSGEGQDQPSAEQKKLFQFPFQRRARSLSLPKDKEGNDIDPVQVHATTGGQTAPQNAAAFSVPSAVGSGATQPEGSSPSVFMGVGMPTSGAQGLLQGNQPTQK